ncbi:MAG: triose-phosphate isomerase [Spirochaetes bacterium]|nr:triose-phosphate isomerase [Spirochaetota bacterium]
MKRREIFAGNWKMYKTYQDAVDLVKGLSAGVKKTDGREYAIFIPAPYLRDISSLCADTLFVTGAQNMYFENQGAFTGEISPLMVRDCGAAFILIGHSERRHIFHETDEDVNKKVRAALTHRLQPMICVGELLNERENNETLQVLERQVKGALLNIEKSDMAKISIAYEPVWAIGTGKVATPEIAEEAHISIRNIIKGLYGSDISESIPVLYGGSVKPDNIAGLYKMNNIDGVLVGGASLETKDFLPIVNVKN